MTTAIILFAHGARDPEWANPLRRIASSSASLIAPRSPVTSAAATPPADPSTCSWICRVNRARSGGGVAATITLPANTPEPA